MAFFKPKQYVSRFERIDFEKLYQQGIRLLLLDNDNTLLPYQEVVPPSSIKECLKQAKEIGFRIYLFSNAGEGRVSLVASLLGIEGVSHAAKPLPKKALEVIGSESLSPEQTAFIGDQLFTDILGGNLVNGFTILVRPIDPKKDEWQVKLKRVFEKPLMYLLRIHQMLDKP